MPGNWKGLGLFYNHFCCILFDSFVFYRDTEQLCKHREDYEEATQRRSVGFIFVKVSLKLVELFKVGKELVKFYRVHTHLGAN